MNLYKKEQIVAMLGGGKQRSLILIIITPSLGLPTYTMRKPEHSSSSGS